MEEQTQYGLFAYGVHGGCRRIAVGNSLPVMERLFDAHAALIEEQNQGDGPFVRELELVAKPTISVNVVPTDTLASGDISGGHCFSYMLALETADGRVSRFWVSDDLELLTALQKAIDPLLVEDNVHSKPGEHYVRSIIYGRDVVAKRLFDLPERALDGEDVGMDVALSRILSGMEGTDE